MELGLDGQKLTGHGFGYTVALTFTGGYEVQIESPFWLRSPDGNHDLTSGEDEDANRPLLDALVGQVVTVATVGDSGALRIDFNDGSRLLAVADANFEAWNLAGPKGKKVVCLPGGELATWKADE